MTSVVSVASPRVAAPQDVEQLLLEWLSWWWANDGVEPKLPNALQVRTAMALVSRGIDVPVPESLTIEQ